MTVLLLVLGLIALVAGAEALVRGASRIALTLGVSPLVVGLTIVAFGTSAPEAAVSIGAAIEGSSDVAVGNVVGSNIFNVLFILGVSALVRPLVVHAQIIRQELPVMIGASILLVLLVQDGKLQPLEGGLLVTLVILYTTFIVRQSRLETRSTEASFEEVVAPRARWDRHWSVQLLLVLGGLVLLVLGSNLLVEAAIDIARALGVSDLVIGLTIVAAGTSLPEVATSIVAAARGERDIAIGNIIGSNTFNLLFCLGASSAVSDGGLAVSRPVLDFDLWVMLGVAAATVPLFITGYRLTRPNGLLLLLSYFAYTTWLVLDALHHPALEEISDIMMTWVLGGAVVLLVVMMVIDPNRPGHGRP